jgi:hypothetical protein
MREPKGNAPAVHLGACVLARKTQEAPASDGASPYRAGLRGWDLNPLPFVSYQEDGEQKAPQEASFLGFISSLNFGGRRAFPSLTAHKIALFSLNFTEVI